MALSAHDVSEDAQRPWNSAKHVKERQLSGQCYDGKFLRTDEERIAIRESF